jgi:hypothetical protein
MTWIAAGSSSTSSRLTGRAGIGTLSEEQIAAAVWASGIGRAATTSRLFVDVQTHGLKLRARLAVLLSAVFLAIAGLLAWNYGRDRDSRLTAARADAI